MSEQTIYLALRSNGLSHEGTCAMMGNMYCESGLLSNNVENRCTLGDHDYTYAVDVGTISRYQFKVDAFGYGLCQWTYPTRKEELYDLAKLYNVSISDETLQCNFCIAELKRDFPDLYQYLCETLDVAKASERICAEFERPAINNFAARINAAMNYYNRFLVSEENGYGEDPQQDIVHPAIRTSFLHLEHGDGCNGTPHPAVKAWQNLLICWGYDLGYWGADGKFWDATKAATEKWQRDMRLLGRSIEVNGVVDEDDWLAIVEVPE